MGYYEDNLRGQLRGSAFGLNDALMNEDQRQARRSKWQQHEYSRQDFQARQAVARGIIAPEDFEEARSSDRSTFVQKALGFGGKWGNHNSGSWLETLGDVLSVGSVATGSVSKATIEDPALLLEWKDPLPAIANNQEEKKRARVVDQAFSISGAALGGPEALAVSAAEQLFDADRFRVKGPAQAYGQVKRYLPSSFRVGFAPSAFAEAWHHKTNYAKLVHQYGDMTDRGEFWTGLAGDVLLDPTTFLTFGVSAGAKASLSATARGALAAKTGDVAAAALARGGGQVTLTRYGTELYHVAANKLLPQVKDELIARGEDAGRFLDSKLAPEWHDRVVNYMVENFDEVQQEFVLRQSSGLWNHARAFAAPASQAGRAKLLALVGSKSRQLAGYGLDAAFQETASLGTREIGLYSSTKLQQALAGKGGAYLPDIVTGSTVGQWTAKAYRPVGRVMAGVFDVFDHGWDAPPALYEQFKFRQIATQTVLEQAGIDYSKALGALPRAVSQELADVIEGRVAGVPGALASRTAEQEAAMAYFTREMDNILSTEQAAGLGTERVEGYVAHVINPEIRKYYDQVVDKSGEFSKAIPNRYAHQRVIANLAAGEEVLGEGVFKKDLLDVLISRRRASINLLNEHSFAELAIKQYGVAALIVHNVQRAGDMSKSLLRGWARRAAHGVEGVLTIDQVWRAKAGRLTELGFREGAENYQYNHSLVSYLLRPTDDVDRVATEGLSGRFSPAGLAEAERLGVNQAARLHYVQATQAGPARPLSDKFRWRPLAEAEYRTTKTGDVGAGLTQGGRVRWRGQAPNKASIEDALSALDDTEHPLWDQVFDVKGMVPGKVHFNGLHGFLGGVHNWLTSNVESQLGAFLPDVEERVLAAWLAARARAGLKPAGPKMVEAARVKLAGFLSQLAGPLEVRRLEPQVPQALVEHARATRRSHGVLTDDTPALAGQRADAEWMAAQLGFTSSMHRQLTQALFHEDEIRTVAQFDLFEETLRPFLNEAGQVDVLKAPARRLGPRFGDEVVLHDFKLARKVEGNVLPERHDPNLGIPAAEGRLGAKTVGGAELRRSQRESIQAGEVPPPTATYSAGDAAAPAARQTDYVQSGLLNQGLGEGPGAVDALPWKQAPADVEALATARASLETANDAFQRRKAKLGRVLPARAVKLQREVQELTRERKKLRVVQAATTAKSPERKTAAAATAANLKQLRETTAALEKGYGKHLGVYKEVRAAFDEDMKTLQAANAEVRRLLAEQGKARDEAIAQAGATFKGGIETPRPVLASRSPADELRGARRREGQFFQTPTSEVDRATVEAGLADERAGARAGMYGPVPEQTGRLRMDTKPIHLQVYLPRSVGKLINDFNAPGVPPWLPDQAKRMLVAYDRVMDFYKANLLLPWPGYWARNGLQSGATTVLRHGLSFLDPTDNFLRARTSTNALRYALGHYVNPTVAGLTKESWEALGETEVKSLVSGRVVKLKHLDEEMRLRGIYHGTVSSGGEYDDMRKWSRPASAVAGAAAGAAASATAYGLTGDPNNPQAFSYATVIGAVAGGLLGGRAVRPPLSSGWWGGLPVRSMNKATGLIQSGWRPVVRPLEAATELPWRVHMFTQEFLEHGSAGRAASEVYKYLNDYYAMSPFERRWMRRMVPFYSWTKGALRITAHNLTEDPGRTSVYTKFFRDFNYAYDADPEDVPDYLTNHLALVVADHAAVADREQQNTARAKGAPDYRVWSGFGLPIEDSVALVQGLLPGGDADRKEFLQGVLARGAMPLVSAFELLSQQDTFTGRAIEEAYQDPKEWETAPSWMKRLVGYQPEVRSGNVVQKAHVNPQFAWALQEIPVSRFVKLIRSIYEMDEASPGRRQLDTYALARQLAGSSVYRVDPDSQRYFINRGRLEKLRQLLEHVKVGTFR